MIILPHKPIISLCSGGLIDSEFDRFITESFAKFDKCITSAFLKSRVGNGSNKGTKHANNIG